MLKKYFLFLGVIVISSSALAKVQYLRLAKGKVVAYEYIQSNSSGSVLILLPGVNRSLESSDRAVRLLVAQGWNVLMPSLSAHPLSLQGLDKSERAHFAYDSSIRSGDFAEEVEALVDVLEIKRAMPVTLSYSSSVGAFLNPQKFPHVIETVPLGTAMEADPEAAKKAELWESWLRMNPFMAPIWIRQFRDQTYYAHWSKIVDKNLTEDSEYYGSNPRVSDIKAGYVSIARAVEYFNFPQWDFSSDKRTRDFVFAGKENPERLKNQIEMLQNYLETGRSARVVVVASAGHILPTDNPAVYAGVVGLLASQKPKGGVQFAVVNTAEDLMALQWQDRSKLESWIKGSQH